MANVFGGLSETQLLERRQDLEKYLRSLVSLVFCSDPDTVDSSVLKKSRAALSQFLELSSALGTGTEHVRCERGAGGPRAGSLGAKGGSELPEEAKGNSDSDAESGLEDGECTGAGRAGGLAGAAPAGASAGASAAERWQVSGGSSWLQGSASLSLSMGEGGGLKGLRKTLQVRSYASHAFVICIRLTRMPSVLSCCVVLVPWADWFVHSSAGIWSRALAWTVRLPL
jgi:hypothetical protein